MGPGAVAGVDPDAVAADSYRFLRAVVDASDVPEGLMFRALRAVAQVENTRAAIRNAGEMLGVKKEMLVNLINSVRRAALADAGVWADTVRRGERWFVDMNDNVALPASWLRMGWPLTEIAVSYCVAGDAERFRRELRSIHAMNRSDDWERLLAVPAA